MFQKLNLSNNSAISHMTVEDMVQAGALNAANPIICSCNIVAARSQLGLLSSWVKEEKKDKIIHMHTRLKAQKLLTFYKLFTELSTWILQQPSNLRTAWLEVEKCKLCTFLLLFRPWSLCVLCMTPRLHWCLSCHSMDVGFLDPCTCFTITARPLLLWRCGVPSRCMRYCKATLAILWSLRLNLVLN